MEYIHREEDGVGNNSDLRWSSTVSPAMIGSDCWAVSLLLAYNINKVVDEGTARV